MKNLQSVDHGMMNIIHKNNVEAMTNANRLAVKTLQSIAKMQAESMRGVFEEMNVMAHKVVNREQDDDNSAGRSDWQRSVDRAISDSLKMSGVIMQAQQQFIENAHRQFTKTAEELRDNFTPCAEGSQ